MLLAILRGYSSLAFNEESTVFSFKESDKKKKVHILWGNYFSLVGVKSESFKGFFDPLYKYSICTALTTF